MSDREDQEMQNKEELVPKKEKQSQSKKSHHSSSSAKREPRDSVSYAISDNIGLYLITIAVYVIGLFMAGDSAHKYFVESVGTFFLVFTVGNVVIEPGAGPLAPIPIGCCLMVMIYAGGHISGGHFNPAVTLGVWFRGALPSKHVIPYMIYQLFGSFLASNIVGYIQNKFHHDPKEVEPQKAFLAEFLGTFALVWVVINTATDYSTQGNSDYGMAIGITVMVMAFSVGGVSGGAFNPAVAVGAAVMRILKSEQVIFIHIIADFAGGIVAGLAYRLVADEINFGA